VVAGADPFNIVFSCTSALGTIGIVMLQAVTSFSVASYFRATKKDTRLWHALLAPILGGIGLLWIGFELIGNLDALSGSDSAIVRSFPWIVLGLALAGIALGLVLKRSRPDVYARFGQ
jgi:hypothetical protein